MTRPVSSLLYAKEPVGAPTHRALHLPLLLLLLLMCHEKCADQPTRGLGTPRLASEATLALFGRSLIMCPAAGAKYWS